MILYSLTPGHISGGNRNSKRNMHSNVHSSTIHKSQDIEATKMSINKLMDKEDVVHIYNGVLLSYINTHTFKVLILELKECMPVRRRRWSEARRRKKRDSGSLGNQRHFSLTPQFTISVISATELNHGVSVPHP